MLQKILKIGNSFGVTLPRDFVTNNKIKKGELINVTQNKDTLVFSTQISAPTKYEEITDKELIGLLKEVEEEYKDVLDELADK